VNLKVVILAGGLGSRLEEYTKIIPKPLVSVGGKPIICHLIDIYSKFNFTEFYIATGYKSEKFSKFFKKKDNNKIYYTSKYKKCEINLIYTGNKTMTGGRIKILEKYLKNETFLLTYGDGLANVNIKKLLQFHRKRKKIVTVTAVRPPARFGEIKVRKNVVIKFKEKPQVTEGWINGGFFVIEPKFFRYLGNHQCVLEKEPLEKMVKLKQLSAFKHFDFWQCIDTKRDIETFSKINKKKILPWLK